MGFTLLAHVTPRRQVGLRINYSHVNFPARRLPDAFLRLRRGSEIAADLKIEN